MTSFRAAYRADIRMRLLDAILHLGAALLVAGPWWFQYVPDLVLPALWLRGMLTNRFEPPDSWLLQLHQSLHLRSPHEAITFLWLFACALLNPLLALHIALHAAIDLCTHSEEWQ